MTPHVEINAASFLFVEVLIGDSDDLGLAPQVFVKMLTAQATGCLSINSVRDHLTQLGPWYSFEAQTGNVAALDPSHILPLELLLLAYLAGIDIASVAYQAATRIPAGIGGSAVHVSHPQKNQGLQGTAGMRVAAATGAFATVQTARSRSAPAMPNSPAALLAAMVPPPPPAAPPPPPVVEEPVQDTEDSIAQFDRELNSLDGFLNDVRGHTGGNL